MSFQHSSFAPSALFRSFFKIISAQLEGDTLAASLEDWSPLFFAWKRFITLAMTFLQPSLAAICWSYLGGNIQRCPQRLPCWKCDHITRETLQQLKGNISYYTLFWNLLIYCLLLYKKFEILQIWRKRGKGGEELILHTMLHSNFSFFYYYYRFFAYTTPEPGSSDCGTALCAGYWTNTEFKEGPNCRSLQSNTSNNNWV